MLFHADSLPFYTWRRRWSIGKLTGIAYMFRGWSRRRCSRPFPHISPTPCNAHVLRPRSFSRRPFINIGQRFRRCEGSARQGLPPAASSHRLVGARGRHAQRHRARAGAWLLTVASAADTTRFSALFAPFFVFSCVVLYVCVLSPLSEVGGSTFFCGTEDHVKRFSSCSSDVPVA